MRSSGVIQGLLVLRIERNGLVQRRNRLLRVPRVQLNDPCPHQRLDVARLQLKLCLQGLQRPFRLSDLVLRDTQKKMNSREPRVELGRMFQRMDRVLRLPLA